MTNESGYLVALWIPTVGIAVLISMGIRYPYLKSNIK
jgi:hypothetical protein